MIISYAKFTAVEEHLRNLDIQAEIQSRHTHHTTSMHASLKEKPESQMQEYDPTELRHLLLFGQASGLSHSSTSEHPLVMISSGVTLMYPFPLNPTLHEHEKEPIVFSHVACVLHGLKKHSSRSTQPLMRCTNPE